ncbi:NADP-dependent oxidoreductase [Microbacterium karelineae]|uniref:NADP-dependent oxidoreductase n=1 Tax=Microbacterium karelineae TaxID=2654283 RepID=UPI0012E9D919|nr:NADP-dependent oxidoreductase [Microbacterium karelineae]
MRALQSHEGRDGAVLAEVEKPEVGVDDIRIRVAAATVNPVDVSGESGGMREAFGLPAVHGLGWDLAGEVVARGADVTTFDIGDLVAALHDDPSRPMGAHADEVVVPASAAARVPSGVSLDDAASTTLNALTAAQALDLLGAPDGRELLVTGAAGSLGGFAVALAAHAGWRVTGLARAADEDFVRRAGATTFATEIEERSVDAVLDAAALQDGALPAIRDGGAFVGVLPPMPVSPERGIDVATVDVRADGARLADLLARLADGTLVARIAGAVPLTDAPRAYAAVASGGQRGRWVLVP